MPHGYTNESWSDVDGVHKHYVGLDAEARMHVELDAIAAIAARVPTPEVLDVDEKDASVIFTLVQGRHGQELLDEGRGSEVLHAAGRMLRRLHRPPAPDGSVFVHGDYGPQNLLFDPLSLEVVAVLDWEFAHRGDPVEDVAWAEWIVRMHHPAQIMNLEAFFTGYGQRPPWPSRQESMIRVCQHFRDAADRADNREASELWRTRVATTDRWQE